MSKNNQETKSYKIAQNLFLVQTTVPSGTKPVLTERPVNHVAVIDCSGSMSYDLSKLREQLKMKVPKLLGEQDTLSVIWFSGRGEFGVLLERETVTGLKDLQTVGRTVDKYLRPVGLTGFKEPLEEAVRLGERLQKNSPKDAVNSLFFMSDGCDNQWDRGSVMKAAEKLSSAYSAVAFVEYGYYADRNLLSTMAEKAGGPLLFAQDFDKYAPTFEAAIQKRVSGAKRVSVEIQGDQIGGFAYAIDNGDLLTFAVADGEAMIPENIKEVFYLSPSSIGKQAGDLQDVSKAAYDAKTSQPAVDAAYAAISLFSVRMKPNVVYPLLKVTGDVALINQFATCYGKQKYSEFMDVTRTAASDSKVRHAQGWDPNRVPKEDAATVLDVLQILADDSENRVLMDHPRFKYSPIGRGRVDASEVLTKEEKEEVQNLTLRIAAEKDVKKLKELTAELAEITAKKGEALKFTADEAKDGYKVDELVPNEDRPNVSFRIKKYGTVDISARMPEDFKKSDGGVKPVPTEFRTFIFRNYTVVKDGLINLACLPVRLSKESMNKIQEMVKNGDLPQSVTEMDGEATLLMLDRLPPVNRKSAKSVSAKDLFEKQFELEESRAAAKVFKHFRDEKIPKKESASFKALYGDTAAGWLKEQGFTDYSGFSPKSVQAEATDFYMGKELAVKLAGLSKLPSMKEYKEQLTKGKLNLGGRLMKSYVDEVEAYLKSSDYTGSKDQEATFTKWIDDKARDAVKRTRGLLFEISRIKFAIVVGQTWFNEFSSVDENSLKVKVKAASKEEIEIDAKVEMKEIEVRI